MMARRSSDSPEVTRRRFLALAAAGGSLAALARFGGRYGLTERILASAEAATPAPVYRLTTDLGIPASMRVDVSGAITQALAQVASAAAPTRMPITVGAGGTFSSNMPTVLLQGAYRVDKAIMLHGLRNLRIAGENGASGFVRLTQPLEPANWPPKTPWYSYIDVRDSQDLVIEGFSIKGPLASASYDSSREEAAGLHISGASSNVTVRNITIAGVHGDFVMISEHRQNQPTAVVLEDLTGDIAGRQMIAEVGGRGATFRRCTFKNSGRSAIDIEPSTPLGSHNLTIEDSTFDNPSLYCLAGGNERPHRNIVVRRTKFFGGKGLAKYGSPEGYPVGSHQGLTLEDVTYQWRAFPGYGTIKISRTLDIKLTRVNARLKGPAGSVEGSGTVQDSTFISDNVPIMARVVYLCGVSDIRNVGTGPCAQGR